MGVVVNTNSTAMFSNMYLGRANEEIKDSMQKLSSGFRINSAKDDAAGLGISNQLSALTRGLGVAIRNGNDALSIAQVAEGAMVEQTQILLRMRDLTLQAANGSNGEEQRLALDAEMQQLQTEITRIADTTTFGTEKLLNGFFETKAFQVGANAWEHLYVDIDNTSASSMGHKYFKTEMSELMVVGSDTVSQINGEKDVRTLEVQVDDNIYNIDLEYGMTAKELQDKVNSIKGLSDMKVDLLHNTGTDRAMIGAGLEDAKVYKAAAMNMSNFTGTFDLSDTMTLYYKVYNKETNKDDMYSFTADVGGVNSAEDLADKLAEAVNLVNINSKTFDGAKNDVPLRGLTAGGMNEAFIFGFRANGKYDTSPTLQSIDYNGSAAVTFDMYTDEQYYDVDPSKRKTFGNFDGANTGFTFVPLEMEQQTAMEAKNNVQRGSMSHSLSVPPGDQQGVSSIGTFAAATTTTKFAVTIHSDSPQVDTGAGPTTETEWKQGDIINVVFEYRDSKNAKQKLSADFTIPATAGGALDDGSLDKALAQALAAASSGKATASNNKLRVTDADESKEVKLTVKAKSLEVLSAAATNPLEELNVQIGNAQAKLSSAKRGIAKTSPADTGEVTAFGKGTGKEAVYNEYALTEYNQAAAYGYTVGHIAGTGGTAPAAGSAINVRVGVQNETDYVLIDETIKIDVGTKNYTNIADLIKKELKDVNFQSSDGKYLLKGLGDRFQVYGANGLTGDLAFNIDIEWDPSVTAPTTGDIYSIALDAPGTTTVFAGGFTTATGSAATPGAKTGGARVVNSLVAASPPILSGSAVSGYEFKVTSPAPAGGGGGPPGLVNADFTAEIQITLEDSKKVKHTFKADIEAKSTMDTDGFGKVVQDALKNMGQSDRGTDFSDLGITLSVADSNKIFLSYEQDKSTDPEFVKIVAFTLGDHSDPSKTSISGTDQITLGGIAGTRTGTMTPTIYSATSRATATSSILFNNSKTDPSLRRAAHFVFDFSEFKADQNVTALGFKLDSTDSAINQTIKLTEELYFLSVAAVNIRTFDATQHALSAIDGAMTQISSVRAELGAMQNRAMHTGNNNQNIQVQVSEANSRILDLDFAEESTRLAKVQILQQTSSSMLTQANQISQIAVQLIQR